VNLVLNWQKSRNRVRKLFDDDAMIDLSAGRRETPEEAMDLESALKELPKGARQIFVLHDVEGFKHEEIADMLDITSGTSKAQLHRARMLMRRHLEK